MLKIRWLVLAMTLISLLSGVPGNEDPGAAAPESEPAGESRADLEIPQNVWKDIRESVDAWDRAIGYTSDEMRNYGRDIFLLPSVLRLFADVSKLPRFSGKVTDELLQDADRVAAFGQGWSEGGLGEMARRCYLLLDISAGRRTTIVPEEGPPCFPIDSGLQESWTSLPDGIRDLACRMYVGAATVKPWVLEAFDEDLILGITGNKSLDDVQISDLYPLVMALRNDEYLEQLASLESDALRLFETTDLAYLGYATVLWLRHVEYALSEFQKQGGKELLRGRDYAGLRLPTPLGDVLIGGTGNDAHENPACIVIELGGDDEYGAGFAVPEGLGSPVAVLLDLAGDDRYIDPGARAPDGFEPAPSFGAGVFGIAALLDLEGRDEYEINESGLGRGCFGSGLLVDFAGDDSYFSGGRWGQGTAHAGIGVLLDLAGNDVYSCAQQSQGMGSTLGTGLLLDVSGNDRYIARDDGNVSELYLNQSVAMSQGCGYGRRADLGDGHSLAGGFGLLVDGGGDDDYHAQVWAQGCGYWWGVGILEDRSGNDRYRNGKYSSGAAAHFAIGLHVDFTGDDEYNIGNDTAKNQFQGHARDGSIGIFIDGDGRDCYEFRSHCAGSGDLASVGLFWDRRGDDSYRYDQNDLGDSDWARTPPLGSTTQYDPMRSFRDDLPVYGIFLDTSGLDEYATGGIGANNDTWEMRRNENAWGLGYDLEER